MTTADLYGNKLTQNNEPSTVQWYGLINTFATKCHLLYMRRSVQSRKLQKELKLTP